jgi:chromosomal replication initiator protein
MNLHITHPKVRQVIADCEQEVRKLTGNPGFAISFVDCVLSLEFEQIAEEVIKVTRVSMEDVMSDSRKIDIVTTRQLIAFYARRFTKATYSEIGEKLGGRDHTTIISSIRRVTSLLEGGDKRMSELVKRLNRRIKEAIEDIQ